MVWIASFLAMTQSGTKKASTLKPEGPIADALFVLIK